MARIEIGRHLAADTRVCSGRLVFRGTRILVSDVMELNEAGYSPEAISVQYRGIISPAAIREARALIQQGMVREVATKRRAVA